MTVSKWLDSNATAVQWQALRPSRKRTKNKVLLSYRDHSGAEQTVGGRHLREAIEKAQARLGIPKEEYAEHPQR